MDRQKMKQEENSHKRKDINLDNEDGLGDGLWDPVEIDRARKRRKLEEKAATES